MNLSASLLLGLREMGLVSELDFRESYDTNANIILFALQHARTSRTRIRIPNVFSSAAFSGS